ncbi:5'/3'-nucleotidase SurE [Aurantiacibacter flavus]|uniref:5'-nucleotidase n=1 Tax=Aurantiacibacter flavus TaxID=3145232 RepID=A0ABV0CZK8_9SPHN
MRIASFLVAAALVAAPAAAEARNIVVSNDDGLTSNVLALYHALKEAGHDVIVSVPCRNQSGQGAALQIGTPLTPLVEPCLNDAAKAGDPAAGPMTREGLPAGDFFYVDGTPIMALAYGLDVAGKSRWNGAPDLVLSGPNEGQNVGAIAISSGTVSNAQFAALRGLPAIALSAGSNTEGADLANPISPEVAALSVELVAALAEKAGDGPLLPQNIALNVNFPDQPAGAAWRATRMGTYNTYAIGFTANMAEDATPAMRAMAEARGLQLPQLPGLSFDITAATPTPGEESDEAYVYRTAIAVSPMQAGYAGDAGAEAMTAWQIGDLTAD